MKKRLRLISTGFTLIELLIVVIIIGILATLIFANFGDIRKKSRDSQRKSDLKQIQIALELYRADQRSYPTVGFPPACGSAFTFGGSTYMQKFPCDPLNTGQYVYSYISTATTYSLRACLENVNDGQKDATNNSSICTGGTTNWSYTVQNP